MRFKMSFSWRKMNGRRPWLLFIVVGEGTSKKRTMRIGNYLAISFCLLVLFIYFSFFLSFLFLFSSFPSFYFFASLWEGGGRSPPSPLKSATVHNFWTCAVGKFPHLMIKCSKFSPFWNQCSTFAYSWTSAVRFQVFGTSAVSFHTSGTRAVSLYNLWTKIFQFKFSNYFVYCYTIWNMQYIP